MWPAATFELRRWTSWALSMPGCSMTFVVDMWTDWEEILLPVGRDNSPSAKRLFRTRGEDICVRDIILRHGEIATGTDKLSPQQLMDKYICAMVTFQVACCSARFDDPSTYQHQATAGGPTPLKGGHRGAGEDRCGRMLDRYICAMTRFQVACNARSMTSNIPAPRVANSRRPPQSSRLGRPRPSGPFGSRRTRPL